MTNRHSRAMPTNLQDHQCPQLPACGRPEAAPDWKVLAIIDP